MSPRPGFIAHSELISLRYTTATKKNSISMQTTHDDITSFRQALTPSASHVVWSESREEGPAHWSAKDTPSLRS